MSKSSQNHFKLIATARIPNIQIPKLWWSQKVSLKTLYKWCWNSCSSIAWHCAFVAAPSLLRYFTKSLSLTRFARRVPIVIWNGSTAINSTLHEEWNKRKTDVPLYSSTLRYWELVHGVTVLDSKVAKSGNVGHRNITTVLIHIWYNLSDT